MLKLKGMYKIGGTLMLRLVCSWVRFACVCAGVWSNKLRPNIIFGGERTAVARTAQPGVRAALIPVRSLEVRGTTASAAAASSAR